MIIINNATRKKTIATTFFHHSLHPHHLRMVNFKILSNHYHRHHPNSTIIISINWKTCKTFHGYEIKETNFLEFRSKVRICSMIVQNGILFETENPLKTIRSFHKSIPTSPPSKLTNFNFQFNSSKTKKTTKTKSIDTVRNSDVSI